MLQIESNNLKFRRFVDYIYLLRVLKFSKVGLMKLFQNPDMEISIMKNLNKDALTQFLLLNQKPKIDSYQNISHLIESDENDQEYRKIEKNVEYCISNNIQIINPMEKDIPKLFQIIPDVTKDLIFVKGTLLDQDLKSYSICGLRTPTPDAVSKTHLIAKYFADKEFTKL